LVLGALFRPCACAHVSVLNSRFFVRFTQRKWPPTRWPIPGGRFERVLVFDKSIFRARAFLGRPLQRRHLQRGPVQAGSYRGLCARGLCGPLQGTSLTGMVITRACGQAVQQGCLLGNMRFTRHGLHRAQSLAHARAIVIEVERARSSASALPSGGRISAIGSRNTPGCVTTDRTKLGANLARVCESGQQRTAALRARHEHGGHLHIAGPRALNHRAAAGAREIFPSRPEHYGHAHARASR
jgi:hypothetical protein